MLLLGVIRLCVCAVIFGTIVGLSNTDRQRQGIIQSGHVEKGYVLPSGRKGALSRPDCSSNGSEQPVEWKDPKPTAFHGEMENLKQLYTSTNGDNWYYNENWNNSSLNFCTWYGVGCDEEGHVLSLSLNDNNLTGCAWH
ncbi:uncharacterized protein LOC141910338 [Tubulanus polymorphus]|uniref:uncharacterized protein LOC141910338 n=1 Tax=Tubulanus polymorphus TaxID=672921 RepID=UPI003DA255BA